MQAAEEADQVQQVVPAGSAGAAQAVETLLEVLEQLTLVEAGAVLGQIHLVRILVGPVVPV